MSAATHARPGRLSRLLYRVQLDPESWRRHVAPAQAAPRPPRRRLTWRTVVPSAGFLVWAAVKLTYLAGTNLGWW
jgi:hypothetical protein